MSYKLNANKRSYYLLVITAMLYVPICRAEITGEFLVFPQADSIFRSELDNESALDKDDQDAGVDFFVTIEINNFRFLSEYLLSSEEQEFERLQVGWLYKRHLFWLGRSHNPIGYWNLQYHHGAYLQTSISRPAIVEFEEKGGILPMHQAGFLAEGTFDHGDQELGYTLAFGAGPEFGNGLESLDVLSPHAGTKDISATLNVYLDSGPRSASRLGFYVNYAKIPAKFIGVREIQQKGLGIYGSLKFNRWRLLGSSFYVHNRIERSIGSDNDAFFNAYFQAEYDLDSRWTFYGRIEGTTGEEGDAYLALFPDFVEDKILGGIRFDLAKQNALNLEVSANHMRQDDFAKVMLQWSAQY